MFSRGSFVLFAVITCANIVAGAGEPEKSFDTAKRLAASQDKRDRAQALQLLRTMAKPGTPAGDEALARYGDLCLRFHAEGEKAGLEEARRAFSELKEKSHSRWALKSKVGLLRVAAAEGKREEAIKGLDWFLSNQGKDDAFIEAAYYLGLIQAETRDDPAQLGAARTSLAYALELWKAQKAYYSGSLTEADISGKLGWVDGRIRELKAGPLKLAFERAEALRNAGKFKEAIPVYESVIKQDKLHILAELSGLRTGQCLEGLKEYPEARKRYEEFIKANPTGPYRGHAHLQLGDIWLEQDFRAACAEVEYSAILHPEKYSTPDIAKAPDFWKGAIDPKIFQARPDATVSREDPLAAEALRAVDPARRKALLQSELPRSVHETWEEVLPDAHTRLGVVSYMRADFKTADEHFSTSYQMRSAETSRLRGVPSGVLLLAEKCRKREMPMPWQYLTLGGDQVRVCLFLASAYIEGSEEPKAKVLCERVIKGEFKDAHPEQTAFALCQLGRVLWQEGDAKGARDVWRKFQSKPYDRTLIAPRALLKLGCTTFTATQNPKDLAILEQVYTRYPNSDAAPLAMFQHASMLWDDEPARGVALLQLLQSRYPDNVHRAQIPGLIQRLQKQEQYLKQKQADAQNGKKS